LSSFSFSLSLAGKAAKPWARLVQASAALRALAAGRFQAFEISGPVRTATFGDALGDAG
jgi:hypothetical protein